MTTDSSLIDGQPILTLDAIAAQHAALEPYVYTTPVMDRDRLSDLTDTAVNLKFELFQAGGSFKVRGAFSHLLALSDAQRKAGVTGVSAGNHAVAVAYTANRMRINAKVVMIKSASATAIDLCRSYGAEVVIADSAPEAFDLLRRIESEEGRYFVHPFNTYPTVLGTSTLGYEWARQSPQLDAVIIPIGGGGLAAGVATAFKLMQPSCQVIGVEPTGADGMAQSFRAGHPLKVGPMSGISKSLMAPHTEAYSFELCRRSIDTLVTVSDDQIRLAMAVLFDALKLAPEPACAASTAALLGPLRGQLHHRRVGLLLCGTNTDLPTLTEHLVAARALAA